MTLFCVTQKLAVSVQLLKSKTVKFFLLKLVKGKVIDGFSQLKADIERVVDANLGHFIFDGELFWRSWKQMGRGKCFQKLAKWFPLMVNVTALATTFLDALLMRNLQLESQKLPYIERRRKTTLKPLQQGVWFVPFQFLNSWQSWHSSLSVMPLLKVSWRGYA